MPPTVSRSRNRRAALTVALLGLAFSGTMPAGADPVLEVVVTMKPIHALVAQVMSGAGEPVLLISGSQSPHSVTMRPSQAAALGKADVVFRVSESVEPFTRKAFAVLPPATRVVTLAEAPGVSLLPQRRGDTFEAHEHNHEQGHAAATAIGHEGEESRVIGGVASGSVSDGHLWLDPRNAKAMVGAIAEALTEARPEEAQRFSANADAARARLDALEAEIRAELEPVKSMPFAVFHDAYQYLERRFGLSAVAAITVSPDVPPSARRLSQVRARLMEAGAACVFAEPTTSPAVVAAVAEGTSARSGVLDPEGLDVAPGPDAYDTLLRRLAKGLKDCLGG